MEKRHTELRNPFRGTKARPARKPARKLAIPTDVEIGLQESEADLILRAAIVMMGQGGLRVGALPSLSSTGSRWTATTKGKEQSGKVPEEAREAVQRAGLSLRRPFADLTATRILPRFAYLVKKPHAGASSWRGTPSTTRGTPLRCGFVQPRTTSTGPRWLWARDCGGQRGLPAIAGGGREGG
jgi:hypothetical protein